MHFVDRIRKEYIKQQRYSTNMSGNHLKKLCMVICLWLWIDHKEREIASVSGKKQKKIHRIDYVGYVNNI